MLIDAELHIKPALREDWRAPYSAHKVKGVEEGLVGRHTNLHVGREIVVWLVLTLVERVAILKIYSYVRIPFATEHGAVVCKIPCSCSNREINRKTPVVMIRLGIWPYSPSIATAHAVETTHRIDGCSGKLTKKPPETAGTVVKNDVAHAIGNLSYADASESGGHEVVDGSRLYLATELPHQGAAKGIRGRLPEGKPVAAGGIVVEIAMIRMGKQIGGELIVVPHKALLEILVYGVHVDLGKLLVQNKAVEAMYQDIDACGLKGCYPWMLGCAVITVCSPYPVVKTLYIRQLGRAASMVSHRKTHLRHKPVLIWA